jgi:hypothetical protein
MLAKSAVINPDIGSVAAMMEKHTTQEQEVENCGLAAKMENDSGRWELGRASRADGGR